MTSGGDKPAPPGSPPAGDDGEAESSLVFDWLPVDKEKRPADSEPAAPMPPQPDAPSPPPAPAAHPVEAARPEASAPESDGAPAMPTHCVVPLPPPPKPVPPPEPVAPARATSGTPPIVPPPPRRPAKPEPQPARPPAVTPPAPAATRPVPLPAVAARTARGRRERKVPLLPVAAVGLLLVGAAGYFASRGRAPRITSANPQRVRAGQTVTLRGEDFAPQAQENEVRFDDRQGRVLRAPAGELQVEVPATIATVPGQDTPVSVVVRSRGKESAPIKLSASEAPLIRALAPDVAVSGDEVVVSGTGWGAQPRVSFGSTTAEVLEATPESLRVKVPNLPNGQGTSVPVVVTAGAERSEPAALLVGQLPLVTSVEPAAPAPGDLLTLRGRGFHARPQENAVVIAGEPALVVSSTERELKVVTPIPGPGAADEAAVEVRVPDSSFTGGARVTLSRERDALSFRFVALPFSDAQGHDHAVLATELGPAFVLSGTSERSAAGRALEAQQRLNESAALLAAPGAPQLELRDVGGTLSIGLQGRDAALLDVGDEDAAAYNESAGGPGTNPTRRVTKARLGAWWLALARDLAALLASGERPRQVALLTPDGRLLSELHDGARRVAGSGVPRGALAELRPEARKGLRTLALRVPPAVVDGKQAEASLSAAEDPLQLEGLWSGVSTEEGVSRPLRIVFARGGGTLTYLKPLQFSVPLQELERPRPGSVHFSARLGTGKRYFQGSWDGETLSGSVSATLDDPPIGRFELRR